MTLMLIGCVAPSKEPVERSLPEASTVVSDPAPRPVIAPGQDARETALRGLQWGRANEDRLIQSRRRYEALREAYANP